MSFINRLKGQINSRENYGGQAYDYVKVSRKDLLELVHHFESMDSVLRDDATPAQTTNKTHSLVLAVQAMFHGNGSEETMDTVMFTIAELRKQQIKQERIESRKTPRVAMDSPDSKVYWRF